MLYRRNIRDALFAARKYLREGDLPLARALVSCAELNMRRLALAETNNRRISLEENANES